MINNNIRAYNEDPEVQTTLKSIQYWKDKLEEDIDAICKRSPGLDICKERTKRLREAELKKREKSVLYRFRSFFKDQF